MDIADITAPEYVSVDSDQRLGKVRSLFDGHNPKGIVVTDDGEYAGVLTQKALLGSHVQDDAKAGSLTTTAPQVTETADVRDVARMLVEGNTRVAPVFDGDDLVGIVAEDDILRAVLDGLEALTVGDIYTPDPVTVTEDATLGRVVNLMREHGISRLPVLDDAGSLAGIVTTHDVVDVVVRDMDNPTVGERAGETDRVLDMPVVDVTSSPVDTVPTGATVREAVEVMLDRDYAGLVVTPSGDDGTVEGVLTKTDVLRALSYTEDDHMDVQVTNVALLDTLSREAVREDIEEIAAKYSRMTVQHAHVRFHEHKEKLRGTPLVRCQIRLRTDRGQVAGSGEGYGAENAFYVALDTLERNVLELKGVNADEEYRGQLLRKLGEL